VGQLAGKATAEFVGTALLVCVVVGSGIMGANLSSDLGVVLIINELSTIFALALLIVVVGPISGAHFNPVVSLMHLFTRTQSLGESLTFIVAQIAGAIIGAIVANVMFDLPTIQFSSHYRETLGMILGEVIATAGLIALIGILVHRKQVALISIAVPAWIGSAYFFTSSTSFANPAVTVGRLFTDTFAGIAPGSVLPFICAQLVGAAIGVAIIAALKRAE